VFFPLYCRSCQIEEAKSSVSKRTRLPFIDQLISQDVALDDLTNDAKKQFAVRPDPGG
jgi:hypothetical protein